jgi:glycine/D-amino acid oxidase-like deaminating enzyme/nitrite reductase/ring-hydroxylating ferredoxin subunit
MNEKISNPLKTAGKNISYWIDTIEPVIFSKLNKNIKCETAVIGGGISGLTTAYFLASAGKKVVVVEDGFIGSGETGRTTAHIASALDDRYYEIENLFNEEKAKLAAQSHMLAIDTIESIISNEKIHCDFERVDGYLFLHPSGKKENLEKEFKAAEKAGLDVELLQEINDLKNIKGPVLKFSNQAQFHPLKYLKGLAESIVSKGGEIYTQTHAQDFDKNSIKTSNGYTIEAENIVVATNTPVSNKFVLHTKQAPYRTYVIAALIPKGSFPKILCWDTGDTNSTWHTHPYHYVRVHSYDEEYDILISGGEDHKTAQADREEIPEEERYSRLYDWTKEHFPMTEKVIYKWSGQVMEPVDLLGFIGKNPMDTSNVYVATGDSGNGITHGTIAGLIISDQIMKIENQFSELYNPSRKTLKSTDTFVEEQLNVAGQYLEIFTDGDREKIESIKSGEGGIIKDEGKNIAVYRDEDGKFHIFSAVCPHLKCIVEWNNDEKSFDCPCHGSRFSSLGKVINGPANVDLKELEIPVPH